MLEKINTSKDLNRVKESDYPKLAAEIRQLLIETLSETGGHLASNLGTVELTMALHLSFDFPEDKLIWDVGHQSYTHKILTGRKDAFATLRQYGGLSGFPKRRESEYDAFDTGHSSTSISACIGMAKARDLCGASYQVVGVIGDGALTNGMAYEALNNLSKIESNIVIVLNDNEMSISESSGGISSYLNNIRASFAYNSIKESVADSLLKVPHIGDSLVTGIKRTKSSLKQLLIPGMFFENLGITYIGPVDGHNVPQMLRTFQEAKQINRPIIVHVLTKKGKGYAPAERRPESYHGVDPYIIETGRPKAGKKKPSYTNVFSQALVKLAEEDQTICAITAAMKEATGLKRFSRKFPDRFTDVGIAEEHAVTMAAGMAAGGLTPVVCLYSTFLQRGFDQLLHDVCLQKLPVIFAVDRAGIVGGDGETHQGVFDLSYLRMIPEMVVAAPKNAYELIDMLAFAVQLKEPIALRYSRGDAYTGLKEFRAPIQKGKSELLYQGTEVALLAVGSMVRTAKKVRELLIKTGINPTVVNMRFVKPLDEEMLNEVAETHRLIVTIEENVHIGGMGEGICSYINEQGFLVKILTVAVPDIYVEQGSPDIIRTHLHMDEKSIVKQIEELI